MWMHWQARLLLSLPESSAGSSSPLLLIRVVALRQPHCVDVAGAEVAGRVAGHVENTAAGQGSAQRQAQAVLCSMQRVVSLGTGSGSSGISACNA